MIRLAQISDAERLALLNKEFNDSVAMPGDIAQYLTECSDNEKTAVAEVDGQVVGFGCLQIRRSWCYAEPWAELTELYVMPEYRRRGLARMIVDSLDRLARDLGATEIILLTGRGNDAAQSLYCDCGYTEQADLVFKKNLV